MPRQPYHALIWSEDRNLYELHTRGQLERIFQPRDEEQWQAWLADQTSLAFQGQSGRLNVHKEARRHGARYWYAYSVTAERTFKRYLGRTANVTLARLEQESLDIAHERSHAPTTPLLVQLQAQSKSEATEAGMKVLLPGTKFSRPRLPLALMVRERLLRDLDAALEHRLTLLSASAGWGKTTLLSAWSSRAYWTPRQPHMVAWVSLDDLDNDPTRFWTAVISALRSSLPGAGDGPLTMLHSPQPPPFSAILTVLLNELNDLASVDRSADEPAPIVPIVLILDDYHVIEEKAIHEALTFLIERLPDFVHLVLSSRVDPELPLSRWRVRGQVVEIRASDLRFSDEETAGFFTQAIGYALPEKDVQLLEQRTEGWVAGLQLAALAMRQCEDPSAFVQAFAGSHRYILDYIQEEILQQQPPAVQSFLLQTSVLRRLNAEVCAALTNNPASQEMLEWLERNNLFVVPLDEHRQWYRVHDLFREVLLARLHATQPEIVPHLHEQAARWWETQGDWREAIAHSMSAGDFAHAAALMERATETLWLNGEVKTLYRWVMALPDAIVQRYARMVLTAALYLINSSASTAEAQRIVAQSEAEGLMVRVEATLPAMLREIEKQDEQGDARSEFPRNPGDSSSPGDHGAEEDLPTMEVALLRRRMRLLRGWLAAFGATEAGDVARAQSICRQLQEDLDSNDEVLWQMIPLSEMVILRATFLREGAFLLPTLLEAKERMSRSGDRFATIKVMQWLAMCHLQAGQLRQARQECLSALHLLQQSGGHAILAGYFNYFLADVLHQWNRLEEAAALSRKGIQDAQDRQQIDLQMIGYLQLVEVELASKNVSGAQETLRRAEQLTLEEGLAEHPLWIAGAQARLWLAQGNLAAAKDWVSHVVFDSDAWDPRRAREFLTLVRVYLAQGQYTQARELLERFSAHLDQPGDVYITIPFLALHFVALHGEGKAEQAREVAARLFSLTEPEGYMRVYLDAGEPMKRTLQALLPTPDDGYSAISASYISRLLAAFEREELASSQPSQPSPLQPPQGQRMLLSAFAPAETLTQREEEVLRLLMSGASNQEIAVQLTVSLATVKKHISNILGKLGVENRTQAVALARGWSLLA